MNAAELTSVEPYGDFASSYDRALGRSAFGALGAALDALVRHYGLAFRSVADLGCGTGLLARHLAARHGATVIAVDRSRAMLRVAAKNIGSEGVRLVQQDIRRLCLPRRVDLVVSTFDTINHLLRPEDVRAVFARVHEHLQPGGFFLFDALTPHLPLARGDVLVRTVPASEAIVVLTARWVGHSRTLRATFARHSRRGVVREEHREKVYSVFELDAWLRQAGFLVRGVHDAGTLEPAHARSPRVIFVAERVPATRS